MTPPPSSLGAALARLAQAPRCERCGRPASACLCDRLPAARLQSPLEVLILQHPREDDVVLGTARIVEAALEGARVVVGLSWASLGAALGRAPLDRRCFALLFSRGERAEAAGEERALPSLALPDLAPGAVRVVEREGVARDLRAAPLEGIVVLDGTWSQAKALYWRNAWLSKLARLELQPREPSMYGKLRKEPRREWVSTLEAVADVLPRVAEGSGADPAPYEATREELRRLMRTMLQRVRDATRDG